jgi:flagellar P-ring protein precursor FlgI
MQLRSADFTTSARLAAVINRKFAKPLARCESAAVVDISIPADWAERRVEFVAELESLSLETDRRSKIIVNERSGTIVAGRELPIRPVAILHGGLSVQVQTAFDVSQPAPFSQGKTTVAHDVNVGVKEEQAKSIQLKQGATVDDLVRSLTAIGATPRDVIAILQNLQAAGALDAEIEVI